MQGQNKRRFDWKPFLKLLATIAIPVALQNLLATTASMVDTIMIASTGALSVGAVGLCAQFSSLFCSSYWGFLGGGMLFISQYWGAKDDDGINRSYGLTFLCIMTVGLLFGVMSICFPGLIMSMYTNEASIQEIGISYLKIAGFAYPIQALIVAMSLLLRATEKVKIPLYASIAALFTNMAINFTLIYGRFGFPALGVRGAAIGTVVSGIVNIIVMVSMAQAQRYPYLLAVREHFRFDKKLVSTYFRKSFPILCNEVFMGVVNMGVNIVLGHQAVEAIIATAVFRTMEGFIISFFQGFTNASSILVGKPTGAGDHETAFERAKRLVFLCPCTIFAACMLLFVCRYPIFTAMGLEGLSYQICSGMLLIFAVMGTVRMTNWIQNDTFRAAGDPVFGTVREIGFGFGMLLPLVILSGMFLHWPFHVVYLFTILDEIPRVIMMLRHTFSGRWLKPVTAEGLATIDAFREAHGIRLKKA